MLVSTSAPHPETSLRCGVCLKRRLDRILLVDEKNQLRLTRSFESPGQPTTSLVSSLGMRPESSGEGSSIASLTRVVLS